MEPRQVATCIFCGKKTEEQHETRIGVVHICSDCIADLEEVLSLWAADIEQEGGQIDDNRAADPEE